MLDSQRKRSLNLNVGHRNASDSLGEWIQLKTTIVANTSRRCEWVWSVEWNRNDIIIIIRISSLWQSWTASKFHLLVWRRDFATTQRQRCAMGTSSGYGWYPKCFNHLSCFERTAHSNLKIRENQRRFLEWDAISHLPKDNNYYIFLYLYLIDSVIRIIKVCMWVFRCEIGAINRQTIICSVFQKQWRLIETTTKLVILLISLSLPHSPLFHHIIHSKFNNSYWNYSIQY